MFAPARDVLKAREGTLADTPFPLLLHALLVEARSCLLELKVRQLEKRILFEEGEPVACSSNLLHETLGKFLVERGKITEAQYQKALSDSVTTGEPFNEVVVKQSLISPFELYKQLQSNLAHTILDCFRWVDAHYRIVSDVDATQTPIRMNSLQLILTGAASFLPFETVERHLVIVDPQRFALVPNPAHALTELKLSAKDTRLLQVLKGRPTFAEAREKSGLDIEQTMRRLYGLCVIGVVELVSAAPQATGAVPPSAVVFPEPRPSAPSGSVRAPEAVTPTAVVASEPRPSAPSGPVVLAPAVVTPSAPTPGISFSDQDEAMTNALVTEFLELRKKDPFDLLGVTEDVAPLPLRKAFLARADRFAPLRFQAAELKEKAEGLLAAYARAFGALSDPDQLALHRKRRQIAAETSRAAPKPSTADQFKIRTTLLDASTQFAEGKRRLDAGAFRSALEYFEYAYDVEPKAKHRAYLAWARYQLNPNTLLKLALQELQETVKADPACEDAWAFAGELQRATGMPEAAEASYRAAQKLNPRNPRYAEQLRELSRLRKK